eukprot:m.196365 g.196365  ORF g.196365 m.196365 type:complete len:986 (-) comp17651_c0_seq2:408-3365(-)
MTDYARSNGHTVRQVEEDEYDDVVMVNPEQLKKEAEKRRKEEEKLKRKNSKTKGKTSDADSIAPAPSMHAEAASVHDFGRQVSAESVAEETLPLTQEEQDRLDAATIDVLSLDKKIEEVQRRFNAAAEKEAALQQQAQREGGTIEAMPYLHGEMERDEAEALLTNHPDDDGLFIVRQTSRGQNSFILTCQNEGVVKHHSLEKGPNSWQINTAVIPACRTLQDVIDFLSRPQPAANWNTPVQQYIDQTNEKRSLAEESSDVKKTQLALKRATREKQEVQRELNSLKSDRADKNAIIEAFNKRMAESSRNNAGNSEARRKDLDARRKELEEQKKRRMEDDARRLKEQEKLSKEEAEVRARQQREKERRRRMVPKWLFPSFTREEAERKLKGREVADGLFLVRAARSQGQYTLSAISKGQYVHHVISDIEEKWYINGQVVESAISLFDIADMLSKDTSSIGGGMVPLKYYISNEDDKVYTLADNTLYEKEAEELSRNKRGGSKKKKNPEPTRAEAELVSLLPPPPSEEEMRRRDEEDFLEIVSENSSGNSHEAAAIPAQAAYPPPSSSSEAADPRRKAEASYENVVSVKDRKNNWANRKEPEPVARSAVVVDLGGESLEARRERLGKTESYDPDARAALEAQELARQREAGARSKFEQSGPAKPRTKEEIKRDFVRARLDEHNATMVQSAQRRYMQRRSRAADAPNFRDIKQRLMSSNNNTVQKALQDLHTYMSKLMVLGGPQLLADLFGRNEAEFDPYEIVPPLATILRGNPVNVLAIMVTGLLGFCGHPPLKQAVDRERVIPANSRSWLGWILSSRLFLEFKTWLDRNPEADLEDFTIEAERSPNADTSVPVDPKQKEAAQKRMEILLVCYKVCKQSKVAVVSEVIMAKYDVLAQCFGGFRDIISGVLERQDTKLKNALTKSAEDSGAARARLEAAFAQATRAEVEEEVNIARENLRRTKIEAQRAQAKLEMAGGEDVRNKAIDEE